MANKIYTAQEMRERAEIIENAFLDIPTAEMLSQAADTLEREEKSQKKYEYAAKYLSVDDETDVISKTHYESAEQATVTAVKVHGIGHVVIRRSVGEWEEVKE